LQPIADHKIGAFRRIESLNLGIRYFLMIPSLMVDMAKLL